MTIDCNWLSGGGYTLDIQGTAPTAPRGTQITNNRFGDAGYGPATSTTRAARRSRIPELHALRAAVGDPQSLRW
jgi:hypothetical protein